MKILFLTVTVLLLMCNSLSAQLSDVDFNEVDSLIVSTQSVDLCLIDGKEDVRFFSKAPEKYSDFKLQFYEQVKIALSFSDTSRFQCGITAEINCQGQAGNFSFSIEPRIFYKDEMSTFRQLISLVHSLKDFKYTPAVYLGRQVNSRSKLKLVVRKGALLLE